MWKINKYWYSWSHCTATNRSRLKPIPHLVFIWAQTRSSRHRIQLCRRLLPENSLQKHVDGRRLWWGLQQNHQAAIPRCLGYVMCIELLFRWQQPEGLSTIQNGDPNVIGEVVLRIHHAGLQKAFFDQSHDELWRKNTTLCDSTHLPPKKGTKLHSYLLFLWYVKKHLSR